MIINQNDFLKSINKKDPLIIDILNKRAELTPERAVFTLYSNGDKQTITFFELYEKVKGLAAFLQQKNFKGERALLLYPYGFDYIIGYFACLYAGVIAVPVYPPESGRIEKTLPRLEIIAKDSQAKIALTTNQIVDEISIWKNEIYKSQEKNLGHILPNLQNVVNNSEKFKGLFSLKWLATDNFHENHSTLWKYPNLNVYDTAYLQYTSGSTGDPKGVIISHENLTHNTKVIYNGFSLHEDEHVGVFWLPIYHDMGLIGGILEPVYSGIHTHLLSPVDFLKRPLKWLQIISDIPDGYKVASGGPNFAYELCARATSPTKSEKLDLSNWLIAFSGSEPVRFETLKKFAEAFSISKFSSKAFFPCYGLAEATLMVTGVERNFEPMVISVNKFELSKNKIVIVDHNFVDKVDFVSVGKSILDGIVKIVEPKTNTVCKENEIGEIWTLSKSNSKGYWNKELLSKETFNAYTEDPYEGPFMRTGDLGFLHKGELFITGRLKDLIIIRGTNYYPQDIEETVENSNKFLRPSSNAAFSVEHDSEEHLVVVQEARSKDDVNWSEVIDDIKSSILSIHNVSVSQIVLIQPRTILKTSSGKIRRRETKQALLNNELDILYNWNLSDYGPETINDSPSYNEDTTLTKDETVLNIKDVKILIKTKLSEELKIGINEIDCNKPFSTFGLDSAKSLSLLANLEDKLDKALDATIFWTYPTINKLSHFLVQSNADHFNVNSHEHENDDFIKKVEQLSEDDAEKLLLEKLSNNKNN